MWSGVCEDVSGVVCEGEVGVEGSPSTSRSGM